MYGAITITGTINRTYPDDQCGGIPGCTCVTTTRTTGVRYAIVEIRNSSNTNIATTFTDSTGHFTVPVASLTAGSPFKLIIWAETAAAQVFSYADSSLIGVQYSYATSQTSTIISITIDLSVDASVPNIRPALHVMDNVVKGYQYAANRGLSMSQVDVFINATGTSYNSISNNLYVSSSELWHDGVVHEYGHYVDDAMSPYRGAAGLSNHSVCQLFDSDPAGVFGEGWANYFMSVATQHTFFYGRWCSVESGPCPQKAQNIEGNIAAVLWDLQDPANETFDVIANEYQKVWNVMDGFNFTNPTLATFMTDYADTRADSIECQYTGAKCPAPTRIIGLSGNLAFGNVQVNTTAAATLTISNSGNSTMTVTSISYPTGFSGAWSGTVAAGGSQPVTVTFAPTTATSYGGTVTVNANFTSGTNTISASGTGTPVPTRIIGLSGNLAFGNVQVNTTATATLTLRNNGTSTMTVTSISYPTGFSGAWSGTVAAGGSQPVTVTFAPTTATSYGGTITVNANSTSGTNTISTSGTGTPVDTPPVRSNGAPSGTLAAGTTQVTLSLSTNENATCRYSTSAGTAYDSMGNTFTTTGSTAHSTVVSGLTAGSHSYYVRCQDATGNANSDDFTISFTIAPSTTGNDNFSNATAISSTPFASSVDTTGATTEATDPVETCGNSSPVRSVWYRYTPSVGGTITADTFNSNYDTILSTYTGSPGTFTPVACNDDFVGHPPGVYTSQISFQATAGITYSFMASAYSGSGGTLTFHLNFLPLKKRRGQLISD